MSIATPISAQSMMNTLGIHTEMAKGAIKITSNPNDDAIQGPSFKDAIKQKVAAVNTDQNVSSALMQAVDSGQSDDLVGAMIASQKASLSFSTMMQIRNRLVQAFDEVMKMSI